MAPPSTPTSQTTTTSSHQPPPPAPRHASPSKLLSTTALSPPPSSCDAAAPAAGAARHLPSKSTQRMRDADRRARRRPPRTQLAPHRPRPHGRGAWGPRWPLAPPAWSHPHAAPGLFGSFPRGLPTGIAALISPRDWAARTPRLAPRRPYLRMHARRMYARPALRMRGDPRVAARRLEPRPAHAARAAHTCTTRTRSRRARAHERHPLPRCATSSLRVSSDRAAGRNQPTSPRARGSTIGRVWAGWVRVCSGWMRVGRGRTRALIRAHSRAVGAGGEPRRPRWSRRASQSRERGVSRVRVGGGGGRAMRLCTARGGLVGVPSPCCSLALGPAFDAPTGLAGAASLQRAAVRPRGDDVAQARRSARAPRDGGRRVRRRGLELRRLAGGGAARGNARQVLQDGRRALDARASRRRSLGAPPVAAVRHVRHVRQGDGRGGRRRCARERLVRRVRASATRASGLRARCPSPGCAPRRCGRRTAPPRRDGADGRRRTWGELTADSLEGLHKAVLSGGAGSAWCGCRRRRWTRSAATRSSTRRERRVCSAAQPVGDGGRRRGLNRRDGKARASHARAQARAARAYAASLHKAIRPIAARALSAPRLLLPPPPSPARPAPPALPPRPRRCGGLHRRSSSASTSVPAPPSATARAYRPRPPPLPTLDLRARKRPPRRPHKHRPAARRAAARRPGPARGGARAPSSMINDRAEHLALHAPHPKHALRLLRPRLATPLAASSDPTPSPAPSGASRRKLGAAPAAAAPRATLAPRHRRTAASPHRPARPPTSPPPRRPTRRPRAPPGGGGSAAGSAAAPQGVRGRRGVGRAGDGLGGGEERCAHAAAAGSALPGRRAGAQLRGGRARAIAPRAYSRLDAPLQVRRAAPTPIADAPRVFVLVGASGAGGPAALLQRYGEVGGESADAVRWLRLQSTACLMQLQLALHRSHVRLRNHPHPAADASAAGGAAAAAVRATPRLTPRACCRHCEPSMRACARATPRQALLASLCSVARHVAAVGAERRRVAAPGMRTAPVREVAGTAAPTRRHGRQMAPTIASGTIATASARLAPRLSRVSPPVVGVHRGLRQVALHLSQLTARGLSTLRRARLPELELSSLAPRHAPAPTPAKRSDPPPIDRGGASDPRGGGGGAKADCVNGDCESDGLGDVRRWVFDERWDSTRRPRLRRPSPRAPPPISRAAQRRRRGYSGRRPGLSGEGPHPHPHPRPYPRPTLTLTQATARLGEASRRRRRRRRSRRTPTRGRRRRRRRRRLLGARASLAAASALCGQLAYLRLELGLACRQSAIFSRLRRRRPPPPPPSSRRPEQRARRCCPPHAASRCCSPSSSSMRSAASPEGVSVRSSCGAPSSRASVCTAATTVAIVSDEQLERQGGEHC